MTWYEDGYNLGKVHATGKYDLDPRWSFAEAAKSGKEAFADFKRGFEDGYKGKERES